MCNKNDNFTPLIPMPDTFEYTDRNGAERVGISGIHTYIAQFEDTVAVFMQYIKKLGYIHDAANGDGAYISILRNACLENEGYEIFADAKEREICVYASGVKGIWHALATLLQLADDYGRIPGCHIKDKPDCSFRSVMIDLARNWHGFDYLLEYVDMCVFYKIPVLHLHFTDDQSYTLPSRLFPELSTEGRHYTFEQISELDSYAAARGVEIMPEIDVPGHCTSFAQKYGDIFGRYGIITQTAQSMDAMYALFRELCDMFPHSRRIHVGGDEAAIIKWTENAECRDYALSRGIDYDNPDKKYVSERMLADFVGRMAGAVISKGKIPMAWEGFGKCVNEFVSRDIHIMSWENFYQTTPELLEAGFRIVNSSWNPMYIVTPVAYWTRRQVFDWSIYKWTPVHPGSPYAGRTLEIQPDENVIGGQLLAWGDAIKDKFPVLEDGIAEEQRLVCERAPFMSENTWNREKRRDFEDIDRAYEICNQKLRILLNKNGK